MTATALFVKDGNGNVMTATNLRPVNPPAMDIRVGTFAQLASRTTYQVYSNVIEPNPNYNPCGINPALTVSRPELLGSFTTR